jgi:hypothetical protein
MTSIAANPLLQGAVRAATELLGHEVRRRGRVPWAQPYSAWLNNVIGADGFTDDPPPIPDLHATLEMVDLDEVSRRMHGSTALYARAIIQCAAELVKARREGDVDAVMQVITEFRDRVGDADTRHAQDEQGLTWAWPLRFVRRTQEPDVWPRRACVDCGECLQAGVTVVEAMAEPLLPGQAPPALVQQLHEECWQSRLDGWGRRWDEAGDVAFPRLDYMPRADCGHACLWSDVAGAPAPGGSMCPACLDAVQRTTMSDPNVVSYQAILDGDSVTTKRGGKLGAVVARSPCWDTNMDRVWVIDPQGRVWRMDYIREGVNTCPGVLEAGFDLPPDDEHAYYPVTVRCGDTVLVDDDLSPYLVASVGDNEAVAASLSDALMVTLAWSRVRDVLPACCGRRRHECRCVNRVPKCALPGCNERGTLDIRYEVTLDIRCEVTHASACEVTHASARTVRVCPAHHMLLATRPGWS